MAVQPELHAHSGERARERVVGGLMWQLSVNFSEFFLKEEILSAPQTERSGLTSDLKF